MDLKELITLIGTTTFIDNLLLITFFVIFGYVFLKESKDSKSPLNWVDMLIDKKTNKLSLSQLGQFWGIVIGGWMMVFLSQIKEAYSALTLLFPAWLAFLGGSYAFTKYLTKDSHKSNTQSNSDDKEEK